MASDQNLVTSPMKERLHSPSSGNEQSVNSGNLAGYLEVLLFFDTLRPLSA